MSAPISFRSSPLAGISRLAIAVALAAALAGCAKDRPTVTGSINAPEAPVSDADWRQRTDELAKQYKAKPTDRAIAIAYARALRASDQRAQAAAVLQQASMRNPKDKAVLGAYGRALADIGQFRQALDILGRAHSPDQPDWRILNAQGAVLDQMGQHADAQRYYQTALKIEPNEPAILSNLGLSYALAKNLGRAEATLKQAAASPRADAKVRQNLSLVLALQSKFEESQRAAEGVLPAEQVKSNVAYFRELMEAGGRKQQRTKTAAAG